MTSKTSNGRYSRPTKQQLSYLNEKRVPVPQIVAHGFLGTKDTQADGMLVTEFQDLTGLYKLEGSQIKLLINMLGMLDWRIEKDETTQKSRPVTEVRAYHATPKIQLPYIEIKSIGSLVRSVTGTERPKQHQYDAVKRDLLALEHCLILWQHPLKDSNGEYLQGATGLVISHFDTLGEILGLYFHPIVLETDRFLTLRPTIFDDVKRIKGGTVLPDYYYRLIFLVALHGGRGTKPYNKKLPELIKELGLNRMEGQQRKRSKDCSRKMLEEALAILSRPELGLIGKYSIDERTKVVRWETGPQGRAQKMLGTELETGLLENQ